MGTFYISQKGTVRSHYRLANSVSLCPVFVCTRPMPIFPWRLTWNGSSKTRPRSLPSELGLFLAGKGFEKPGVYWPLKQPFPACIHGWVVPPGACQKSKQLGFQGHTSLERCYETRTAPWEIQHLCWHVRNEKSFRKETGITLFIPPAQAYLTMGPFSPGASDWVAPSNVPAEATGRRVALSPGYSVFFGSLDRGCLAHPGFPADYSDGNFFCEHRILHRLICTVLAFSSPNRKVRSAEAGVQPVIRCNSQP